MRTPSCCFWGYFQISNRSKHRDLLAVAQHDATTTPDKDIKCAAKADVSPALRCARCMSRMSAPWITKEVKTAKWNLRWAETRRGSSGLTVHKFSLSKEIRKKKKLVLSAKRKHYSNDSIIINRSYKALFCKQS